MKSGGSFDGDEDGLESTIADGATLKDHLEAQLAIAALTADDRLICMALIDAIDEAGYLRADLDEIAARLGTDMEDVEAVLGVLQGFDPVGVGARDLAECLALQLKAHDRLDPAMAGAADPARPAGPPRHGAAYPRCAASMPKTSPT